MTLIIGCIIFAAILPLLAKAPLGYIQSRQPGGYDNRNPRTQQANLQGIGQRALAAHQNAFEAFPPFAAGVLLALWAHAPLTHIQILCGVFVVARSLHTIFYLTDLDKLRSLSWALGLGASIWLMTLGLAAHPY